MKDSLFAKFYQLIIDIGSNLESAFLLALRLFFGGSFFMAGLGKIQNIDSIAQFLEQLNIPFPLVGAYATSLVELIGGACLFLGLGSRLAAFALSVVMCVAISTASRDALLGAYDDPQKLITQVAFVYLMACITVFIFGPGKVSVDALIKRTR